MSRDQNADSSRDSEMTDVGEQVLMHGVKPVRLGDTLRCLASQPMSGPRKYGRLQHRPQNPCNHGLFDEVSRAQTDLLDLIKTTSN